MGSKYQPVKFCLQSVRVEFLRLAREIHMFPEVVCVCLSLCVCMSVCMLMCVNQSK